MSCPRRRQCGGGNSWSYSWSSCNGVTTYHTSGNVPQQYLQESGQADTQQNSGSASSSKKSGASKLESKADSMKDYYEYGLYIHNWYRKQHGSPNLALDDRLNKAADAYAYKLACQRCLQHTSGLDYNENLYMSSDTSLSKKEHVRLACKAWYDEIKLYNFNNPGFSMQTGHFTAMVFKSCRQLGIGVGVANGWVVVVANYKPHANMQGQFQTNVLPWREVEDSSDEEEDEEEEEESTSKDEESQQKKAAEKDKEDDSHAREMFKTKCDDKETIGWSELKDLLNDNFKVEWDFEGFDKTICSLLISMMTLRNGEKKRIGLEEFKEITDSVIGFLDAYAEFDKDNSGLLDPFELKQALQEAGFDISYKTYQTLQRIFATEENGELNFRGFVLCFILLSKLQIVQERRKSFEDFSMKDWMENELKMAAKE